MEQSNHVYILRGEGTKTYKIGRTSNINGRLESIRTGSPVNILVEGFYAIENAVKVETYLHYKLQRYSKRLEWFDLPDDVLETLKESLRKVSSPCRCSNYCSGELDFTDDLESIIKTSRVTDVDMGFDQPKDRTVLYGNSLLKTNDRLPAEMFVPINYDLPLCPPAYKNYVYHSKKNAQNK